MPNRPSNLEVFKFMRYPPIILVSLNVAILFGSFYCLAVTFPTFLEHIYRFSPAAIGAAYLAPGMFTDFSSNLEQTLILSGIGMVVGSMSSGRYSDWSRSKALKMSEDGVVSPEQRLRSQYLGIILFPMGILMYGWFCHFQVHVSAVLVASFIGKFRVIFQYV
jgi:predicted MFS family arabinose efflux permease